MVLERLRRGVVDLGDAAREAEQPLAAKVIAPQVLSVGKQVSQPVSRAISQPVGQSASQSASRSFRPWVIWRGRSNIYMTRSKQYIYMGWGRCGNPRLRQNLRQM